MTRQECSSRQQAPASFDKDLRAGHDVGVVSIFTPMMTDAADRGYEKHARRRDRRENLGVMAGAAGHADRFAAGKGRAGSFDCLLEYAIHHGGGAPTETPPLNPPVALRRGPRGPAPAPTPPARQCT